MGELGTEPSMEDILSSIKRIIAEEGDVTPGRARRPGRAMAPPPRDDDEVLELSDPIPDRVPDPPRAERNVPETEPRAVEPRPRTETAMPVPSPKRSPEPPQPDRLQCEPAMAEPIASPETAQATRGALDQLSRLLVKPEPGADGTLEGMVREMLRPMLRDWIDTHLPDMVEAMVAKEIARITGAAR